MRTLLIAIFMLSLAPAAAYAGKVYKWVDKDGNVHYTNTPPPEAAQRERQILDEHGNVAEVLEAPKTPEEIEAERQRQAEIERQKQLAEEQKKRDHVLLQTYTTVGEMEMARDGRINALEAQIKVVSGTISSLESELAGLEQRAEMLRKNGKPLPEDLQQQIDGTRAELLNNQKFLVARKQEQERIRERYAADIERFKELKGLK